MQACTLAIAGCTRICIPRDIDRAQTYPILSYPKPRDPSNSRSAPGCMHTRNKVLALRAHASLGFSRAHEPCMSTEPGRCTWNAYMCGRFAYCVVPVLLRLSSLVLCQWYFPCSASEIGGSSGAKIFPTRCINIKRGRRNVALSEQYRIRHHLCFLLSPTGLIWS